MQKTLAVFQKTNSILSEYDENYAEVYSEIRDHFVKLFETIFNKTSLFVPQAEGKEGRSEREKLLFKENELLKARVQHITSSSPTQYKVKKVASGKRSPSPRVSPEHRLMGMTEGLSKNSDREKSRESPNETLLTLANTKNWKRENSFLKGFTKAEAGNSLRDVIFKPFSEQFMTEFIRELFDLKKAHDQKTREGGFPRETMEQFMYGYFKKKYGLQPVVVERVLSVTLAIQEFSERNNDIAAFGLVI
jgi:hypothetical protein